MPFEARAFQLAKDPELPNENQDAYAFDPERGIAAIADGVASAIFSGTWADTLVQATVRQPPDPDESGLFAEWLTQCRRRWAERIDTTGLAWFQKAKLPNGAFSTLLWAQLLPLEADCTGSFGGFRLLARAIGDSCLFHVRHGELLRRFPVCSAAEFETNPLALGSVDLGRDALMQFATLEVTCYPDDYLLLTTDAVAEWLYRRIESENPPNWPAFWETGEHQWVDEINALRAAREMRYDDATLLALRVTRQAEPSPAVRPQPHAHAPPAEAGSAVPEVTAQEPVEATLKDEPSPTKAAVDQIADGFGQLFRAVRDKIRKP